MAITIINSAFVIFVVILIVWMIFEFGVSVGRQQGIRSCERKAANDEAPEFIDWVE